MFARLLFALALLAFGLPSPSAQAASPSLTVVASILPVASLTAGVVGDKGEVVLLVPPGQSPHTFSLKPSQARALAKADALIWVGPGLETFLPPLLATLPKGSRALALAGTQGLDLLPQRQGDGWTPHHHGPGHDPHDGKVEEDHAHQGHENEHEHEHEDHDEEEGADYHLWLDPAIARLWVHAIADNLSAAAPAEAETFHKNAEAMDQRLSALEAEMAQALTPVKTKPFVVTHDFTQYLEKRFGLTAIGSITPDPSIPAGVRHIDDLRKRITATNAVCIFAEPQLDTRLLKTVSEGTGLRLGTLDPLGRTEKFTSDTYFSTMSALARDLSGCLAQGATP